VGANEYKLTRGPGYHGAFVFLAFVDLLRLCTLVVKAELISKENTFLAKSASVDIDDCVKESVGVEWREIGGVPCLYADLTTENCEQ
jgi:hypothetical protein